MKKTLAILLCTALLMMTMTVCGTSPASAAQEPAGSPPSGAPAGSPPDGNGGPGGTPPDGFGGGMPGGDTAPAAPGPSPATAISRS